MGGKIEMLYLLLAPISIVCVIILLPFIPSILEGICAILAIVITLVLAYQFIDFLAACFLLVFGFYFCNKFFGMKHVELDQTSDANYVQPDYYKILKWWKD